jgi:hypothetical protein
VLVDARTIPGVSMPQSAFNKGDGLNFSIAAASIIAKTTRDALMEELDREHPGYGFATHKGYPTPEHKEAVRKLGPCAVHRMSFPVIHEIRGEFSAVFYDLQARLHAAANRAALGEFEARVRAELDALEEREHKKLKLQIARRWKVLA